MVRDPVVTDGDTTERISLFQMSTYIVCQTYMLADDSDQLSLLLMINVAATYLVQEPKRKIWFQHPGI